MDRKGLKFYIKRVQKLNNMRAVSRREHKLIRKLLRANSNGSNDWEALLFHFPGKRLPEFMKYTKRHFQKYFKFMNPCIDVKPSDDNKSATSTEEMIET